MRKLYLLTFLILTALLLQPVFCESEAPRETTLPNGLKIITLENHTLPIVSVCIAYKAGTATETPQIAGCSHLLEHLLLVNTKNLPPGAMDYLLTQSGAIYNAYTTKDLTVFYETLPSKFLELALKIEAERMTNLDIKSDILKNIKDEIYKEIDFSDENILEKLTKKLDETAFTVHPYKLPIVGYKESILNLTDKKIKEYYSTYYRPNNAVLILIGDFETKKALKKVEYYFKKIAEFKSIKSYLSEPEQTAQRLFEVKDPEAGNFLETAFHVPSAFSPETLNLMLLNCILADGPKSRLYKALVETNLAYYASVFPNSPAESIIFPKKDPYLLTLFIVSKEHISKEKVSEIVFSEIEKIKNTPVSDEELQRFKNKLLMAFFLNKESNFKMANLLAYYSGIDPFKWNIYQINEITPQEISETAKKYLTLENSIIGYSTGHNDLSYIKQTNYSNILNLQKAERPSSSKITKALKVKRKKITPNEFKIKPTRKILDNGAILIVCPSNSNEAVVIKLLVKAGCTLESSDKSGLANLTANLVINQPLDSEIYDKLDYLGSKFSSDITQLGPVIKVKALSENYTEVLQILKNILQKPVFSQERMNQEKLSLKEQVFYQLDSPRKTAQQKLLKSLFSAENPISNWYPDPAGFLNNITLEDATNFYDKCYGPENIIICITGGINSNKEEIEKINQIFKEWKNQNNLKETKPTGFKKNSPEVQIINFQNLNSNEILIGTLTAPRNHSDFYAVNLGNYILGGNQFKSRLKLRLKDKEKLAQSVYSWLWPQPQESVWELGIIANTNDIELLKKITFDEIKKLKTNPPSEPELKEAKDYFLNSTPVLLDDPDNLAEILINLEYYGLSLNYLQNFNKIYSKITAKQIQEVFKKYFVFKEEQEKN